jgi:CubicO group peptidase (beta-lactamase class C family)
MAAVAAAFTMFSLVGARAATNPEAVGLSGERLERIDAMIERRIAAGDITGAVAIVARRGAVAHVSMHGVMDLETRQPMRSDTLFRIASMTKPIVGVGILMMVEENKLRLTDPVSRYVPEFRNLRVAVARPEGGSGAAPGFDTVAPQREVTIKDLLTHVSGLGSGPRSNSTIEAVARREGETLAHYIPRLGGTALEFEPGTRWAYSPGAGFETLGRVLEIVAGQPLDQFFAQRIFAPLGMRDITFGRVTRSGRGSRRCIGARTQGWSSRRCRTTRSRAMFTSAARAASTARPKATCRSASCSRTAASSAACGCFPASLSKCSARFTSRTPCRGDRPAKATA